MGKSIGDDFREGKVTLPVILAYQRGDDEERRFWRDAVSGRAAGDSELARAVALVKSSRAVDDTLARARHYGARAIDSLAAFPQGEARAALTETVEFAIARRRPHARTRLARTPFDRGPGAARPRPSTGSGRTGKIGLPGLGWKGSRELGDHVLRQAQDERIGWCPALTSVRGELVEPRDRAGWPFMFTCCGVRTAATTSGTPIISTRGSARIDRD